MLFNKTNRMAGVILALTAALQCSFNDMLREPERVGERPGAVGFCTYVKGNTYMGAWGDLHFARKSGDGFVPVELPIAQGEKDGKAAKNILGINDYCYVVTGLAPGNEYALVHSHHSWRDVTSSTTDMSTGNTTYNKSDFEAELVFDADASYSVMPIHPEAGKIKFLGVYEISVKGRNGSKWSASMRPNLDAGYFINSYVYDGETTLRGAEKRVLSWLGMRHKDSSSYWKPIIEKRLSEL